MDGDCSAEGPADFSGFMLVPPNYWKFMPGGVRVRIVFRDRARVGGFFRGLGTLSGKQVIVLCRLPDDIENQVAVPAERVSQLWKQIPADLETKMMMDVIATCQKNISELSAVVNELKNRPQIIQVPAIERKSPADPSRNAENFAERKPADRRSMPMKLDGLSEIIARR